MAAFAAVAALAAALAGCGRAGVLPVVALSGELTPDTSEALELVAGETRKLTRMVEDLTEISRFDAGAAGAGGSAVWASPSPRRTPACTGARSAPPTRPLRGRVPPDAALATPVRARTRVAASACCLLLGSRLLMASCDVPDAGPRAACAPAAGLRSPDAQPAHVLHLHFCSAVGLQRVSRPSASTGSPQTASELLLRGPDPAERARGLATFLPPGGPPRPLVGMPDPGVVDIRLPVPWKLEPTARRQFVRTVADASAAPGTRLQDVRVRLYGAGRRRTAESACSL